MKSNVLVASVMAVCTGASSIGSVYAQKKTTPTSTAPTPASTPAPTPAPPPSSGNEPWKAGVSAEAQAQATKDFLEANDLYAQQAYPGAVEKYRAALKVWDHPLIHHNLSNALVRLDKPLEAAEELELALKYGAQPFKPELYDQALLLQASLKGRVGWIEVSCSQAGAKVSLDGTPLLSCPGTQKVRLLAQEHTVYAELKDHLTQSIRVVVPGGDTKKQDIKLVPIDQAVKLTYPYPRAIPWTIAGVGLAIAGGGAYTYFSGRKAMDDFDDRFSVQYPRGATEAQLEMDDETNRLYSDRESAKFRGTLGISLMAVGGAATVGGLVFALIVNRPRRELPKLDVGPTQGGAAAMITTRF